MKKTLLKTLAGALMLIFLFAAATACDPKPEKLPKKAIADVKSGYDAIPVKKIKTLADISLTLYDPYGVPGNLSISADLGRTKTSEATLAEGTARVDAVTGVIKTLINMFAADSEILNGIVSGGDFLAFRLGYREGMFNAAGDLCKAGETPDYKYTFVKTEDGKEVKETRDIFYGVEEKYVTEFLNDAEFGALQGLNIPSMLTEFLLFDLDWSLATDSKDTSYDKDAKAFLYELCFPSSAISDTLYAFADTAFADFNKDGNEKYAAIYEDVKLYLKKWLTFDDVLLEIKTDADGRPLTSEQSINASFKIHIPDVMAIIKKHKLVPDEYLLLAEGALMLINMTYLGNGASEKNIIEIGLGFNVSNEYLYDDIALDINDKIFAPAGAALQERQLLEYLPDKEGNKEWKIKEKVK